MTLYTLRTTILWTFLLAYGFAVASVLWMYTSNSIYADTVVTLITQLSAIYAVQLSVVVGGIFATQNSKASGAPVTNGITAITLVFLWNILVLGRLAIFISNPNDVASSLESYVTKVVAGSAFLVTGVITYFFVKIK